MSNSRRVGIDLERAVRVAEEMREATEAFRKWLTQDERSVENAGLALAGAMEDGMLAATKLHHAAPKGALSDGEHADIQRMADITSTVILGMRMLDATLTDETRKHAVELFTSALGIVLAAKHLRMATPDEQEKEIGLAIKETVNTIIADMMKSQGSTKQ